MLKQIGSAICLCFALVSASAAHAEFIEFSTTNVQLLKGWGYEVGPKNRAIATFEHFNRWSYGDFFMFSDVTRYDDGGSNIYAEFSPRLSLSKISGQDLSYGLVKDVLLSSTFEVGKRGYNTYLYGGAIDLKLPGFNFATVNLYNRDNPALKGSTWQSTIAWQAPFEIAGLKCISEGFIDLAGREGPRYAPNHFIVPRFLVDIGDLMNDKGGKLFAGIEYQYWHNKFGINGKTESVPQLQLKWVLH